MHTLDRRRAAIAVFVLLTGGCAAGRAPVDRGAAVSAPPPGARLLVTIVVDQLAAWIATERWPALPADGGFARLRREGLWVRALRYDHAATDTAPGHSALYTGAVPRVSGIVGNELIRGDAGETVSILADASTRLVVAGQGAPAAKPGSSLAALLVETVADVLAARDREAAIFAFSLKDRGALFGAGRRPTLALWFEPAEEAFVTSTAFAAAIPAWVTPIGGVQAVRSARASSWDLLDRGWVAAHAATGDEQAGEGDYAGLGRTFPHPIGSAKALRATPVGDTLLLALARAAVARAAPPPHSTLLALSLSSNDYIGHIYGPDSWEAWDELLRLDRQLAELLAFLDGAAGPDGYAVMLTGDHGIGALPELEGRARQLACRRPVWTEEEDDGTAIAGGGSDGGPRSPALAPPPGASEKDEKHGDRERCRRGRRVLQTEVVAALEVAARLALGGADPAARLVAGVADPWVFFTARGRALDGAARARFIQVAAAELKDRGIARIVDARAARSPCPPPSDQSVAALVCRSLPPPATLTAHAAGAPDLYLVLEPRSFFDARYVVEQGVHHGSPYLYDRTVPLLVRAPGRVAAGVVREGPVIFTAFARTAAALLGLPAPAAAGAGEDLTRASDGRSPGPRAAP